MAVDVFDGDTADPVTVGAQVDKLRTRFGLSTVVLVGDRGMLTEARIREEVQPAGLDWISALRSSAIRQLVGAGTIQLSLFDEQDLVEVTSDAYPGERLVVCRNPLLAEQRARKREDLLAATEALLAPIAAATQRTKRRLQGQDRIALRVGKVINRYKMAKHFELTITDESFTYRRRAQAIAAEAARRSVVAPARVSDSAQAKARRKHTAEGFPVHSFRTLLDDLATLCRNRVVANVAGAEPFEMLTQATPLQREAFKLLGVRL